MGCNIHFDVFNFLRMVEEILDTRVMVKRAMKEHKNDKVLDNRYVPVIEYSILEIL